MTIHTSCTFNPCLSPEWRDGLCRYHRAQQEYGAELSLEPMAAVMWLMEVAAGGQTGQVDEHGCIIWPFQSNAGGYGVLARVINGNTSGTVASRWCCEMIFGPPPDDGRSWFAAHNCGRGKSGCVTPGHIEWKTRMDNEGDKIAHDTIMHGTRNGQSRIDETAARKILLDDRTAAEIAEDFGISRVSVSRIKRGTAWRRVYAEVVGEGLKIPVHPTGGRRGSANQNAKLTELQVRIIRESSDPTGVLARRFKTPTRTITAIRNGNSRKFE